MRISKALPSITPTPRFASMPIDDWWGNQAAVPISPTEKRYR